MLPLVAAAITLVLWASAFVAIRNVGERVSPAGLAFGRLTVATLVMTPLVMRRGWVQPTAREWVLLLVSGIGWFGVYNITLNAGERRVDAGTAALIVQVGPLIVAVAATVLFKEPLTRWLVAGILIGFSGVVLIASGAHGSQHQDVAGVLLVLVAAVMYAVGVMSQKPLLARLPPTQVVLVSFVIGGLTCLPWAGGLLHDLGRPDVAVTILYLGLFPTALGFSTWAYALRHHDVGALSLTTFLVPFIATLIAWATLSEVPPTASFAGGTLAILGVLLTRRKPAINRGDAGTQKPPNSPSTHP